MHLVFICGYFYIYAWSNFTKFDFNQIHERSGIKNKARNTQVLHVNIGTKKHDFPMTGKQSPKSQWRVVFTKFDFNQIHKRSGIKNKARNTQVLHVNIGTKKHDFPMTGKRSPKSQWRVVLETKGLCIVMQYTNA
jgi:hypothetical protein